MAKPILTITTFDYGEYDGKGWPTDEIHPMWLVETIQWFQRRLYEIPAEHRSSATCEIGSNGTQGDEDHWGHIKITYTRPETDEEYEKRINLEKEREMNIRQTEIQTLKTLRAKYPDEK